MAELITTLTDPQYEYIMELEHKLAKMLSTMNTHGAEVEFERILKKTEKEERLNAEQYAWLKMMCGNVYFHAKKFGKARQACYEAMTLANFTARSLQKSSTELLLTNILSVFYLKLEGYIIVEDGTGPDYTNKGNIVMSKEGKDDIIYAVTGEKAIVREPVDWAAIEAVGFTIEHAPTVTEEQEPIGMGLHEEN